MSAPPRAAAPPRSTYFAWLDPLRAFAALCVIGYHLIALAGLHWPAWYPAAFVRIGFLGVDLFFAISGAVILHSLAQLQARDPQRFRAAFAWRRAARIVPLYFVTGAACLWLAQPQVLQRPDALQVVLAHLFFVQNLFPSTHGAINGPSWSLGVEMQFYLVVLLLGPWLLTLRLRTLALLGLAVGLGWRAAVWWGMARHAAPAESHQVFIVATQLPGLFDEFVAGMLALRWTLARQAAGRAPRALLLGLAALLAWAGAIALMHRYAPVFWSHFATVVLLRAVLAAAVGLTVATVLALPAPRQGGAMLRLSGDISYGLYLWHMGVLLVLQSLLMGVSPGVFAWAVLGATVTLSVLGWFVVERPVLRAVRVRAAARVIPGGS